MGLAKAECWRVHIRFDNTPFTWSGTENAETYATMLGLILKCCSAEEQQVILLQHSMLYVNQFELTW